METWAIVVAAGRGSRFGAAKQYVLLAGRPVLAWALDPARRCCHGVVLVLPATDLSSVEEDGTSGDGAARLAAHWQVDAVVAGGTTRAGSVRAGLAVVPPSAQIIAVHDGARPLADDRLWRAVIDAVAGGADGAVPTAPVSDTIKSVTSDGRLVTLDRSSLVAVATPQAFGAQALRDAHRGGHEATDDAALVEVAGGRVVAVASYSANLKVTTPADLKAASALLDAGSA